MATPSTGVRKQQLERRAERLGVILKVFERWEREYSLAPSTQDIVNETGIPYGSMTRYLNRLRDTGYIQPIYDMPVYRNYKRTDKAWER